MSTRELICDAIRSHRELVFMYDGRVRLVWPAVHGWHLDTGNELLSAYQVDGSASGPLPAWRQFKVERMRDVRIEDDAAGQLPSDYNPVGLELRVHCYRH